VELESEPFKRGAVGFRQAMLGSPDQLMFIGVVSVAPNPHEVKIDSAKFGY
jgi:hypothetical protein